ncbi:hypothetical protein DVH24_002591 [Malus domestica]|uniref:Uncharacterized protein n=1 Tax=Malus domestica TaxID=3750 RepID=A0A498KAG2_MALDO|nr:hypothetical protein DVH24_002591 [Malus domestica]
MSAYAAASPPSYALSIRDEKDGAAESKSTFLVVAFCLCLGVYSATAGGSNSGAKTDSEDEDRESVHVSYSAGLEEVDMRVIEGSQEVDAIKLLEVIKAKGPSLNVRS